MKHLCVFLDFFNLLSPSPVVIGTIDFFLVAQRTF